MPTHLIALDNERYSIINLGQLTQASSLPKKVDLVQIQTGMCGYLPRYVV